MRAAAVIFLIGSNAGAAVVSSYQTIPVISTRNLALSIYDIQDAAADGSLIAGNTAKSGSFLWSPGEPALTLLDNVNRARTYDQLFGLSPDGSFGAGLEPYYGAVRLEAGGQFVRLAPPPDSAQGGDPELGARGFAGFDVSDSGLVVGSCAFWSADGATLLVRPVAWSRPDAPQELPLPPQWAGSGMATHVSADGARVFGIASPPFRVPEGVTAGGYRGRKAAGVVRWVDGVPQKWITFPGVCTLSRLSISADGNVCAGFYKQSNAAGSGPGGSFCRVGDSPARIGADINVYAVDSAGRLMVGERNDPAKSSERYFQEIPGEPEALFGSSFFMNRLGGTRPIAELAFNTGLPGANQHGEFFPIARGTPGTLAVTGESCRVSLSYNDPYLGAFHRLVRMPNPLPAEPPAISNPGTLFNAVNHVVPSVRFSESYRETPVKTAEGTPARSVTSTWTVSLRGALSANAAASVTGDTQVGFVLGRTVFNARLDDDPHWVPSRRTAHWVVTQEVAGRPGVPLSVRCTWTATSMTLTARCLDARAYPLACPDHLGWAGAVEQDLTVTLGFGTDFGVAKVSAKGKATRHFVEKRPLASRYYPTCFKAVVLSGKLLRELPDPEEQ